MKHRFLGDKTVYFQDKEERIETYSHLIGEVDNLDLNLNIGDSILINGIFTKITNIIKNINHNSIDYYTQQKYIQIYYNFTDDIKFVNFEKSLIK